MHVLITGSSGQIGTNLAMMLARRGDTVEGIDKRKNTWTDEINDKIFAYPSSVIRISLCFMLMSRWRAI